MRVLQINESHEEGGGQERYFLEITESLKKEGIEVFSFSFGKKEFKNKNTLVVKDDKSAIMRHFKRFIFDFSTYFKLRRWIKETNPDIIHIHGFLKSTLAIFLACLNTKAKVVLTTHNFALVCPTVWCVYKDTLKECQGGLGVKCFKHNCFNWFILTAFFFHYPLRNWIIKKVVNLYICPSNSIKKKISEHGFKEGVILNYFIDLKKWKFEKNVKKDIDILYVGRFDREKGVNYLIDALDVLVNKKGYKNLKCALIGFGGEESLLKKYSKSKKLDKNIRFVGKVPFGGVREYYKRAKIVVVPSVYLEQFGIVGLEAMANGVPAIASKVGGIPEWCKDGKTGFLIKPGDFNEIVNKIEILMKNKKLYNKFSENSLKEVKKFDKKEGMKKLKRIYSSVIK
ncbi:glycosyltransferase family 4 protein [Nanoarchaeota archaeon]